MSRLILYSTAGCHLCEEAEALLQQLAAEQTLVWQMVDIASDEALVARYGIRIPVVRQDDADAELGWPFDLAALRRFSASEPA